jgi:hypothetical protein
VTLVPPTNHTARLGLAELQKLCAQGQQIVREVMLTDVGIDALIEVVMEGRATGVFVAVQVKTGDSFVSGDVFRLPTDRGHLLYWAGCVLPVVGIVHEPATGRTAWFDITANCTEERINQGPYILRCTLDGASVLTPQTLNARLIPAAMEHLVDLGQRDRVVELVHRCKERWKAELPTDKIPPTHSQRVAAWRDLVDFLLSPVTSIEEIADIGYRLSWYLPDVDDERTKYLEAALAHASDETIVRLLHACDYAADVVDDYASHTIYIIARIPDAAKRIEKLLVARMVSGTVAGIAVDAIEMIEDDERDDLRKRYASQ